MSNRRNSWGHAEVEFFGFAVFVALISLVFGIFSWLVEESVGWFGFWFYFVCPALLWLIAGWFVEFLDNKRNPFRRLILGFPSPLTFLIAMHSVPLADRNRWDRLEKFWAPFWVWLIVIGGGFLLVALVTLAREMQEHLLWRKRNKELKIRQERMAKERGFVSVEEMQSHLSAQEKLNRDSQARQEKAHRKAVAKAQQELAAAKKAAEAERRHRKLATKEIYYTVLHDLDNTVKELDKKVYLKLNPHATVTISEAELVEAFQHARSQVNGATELQLHDRTYSMEQIEKLAQLVQKEIGWNV